MTNSDDEKPIVISEDAARGALSPEDVPEGDTLVPMLSWGIGLAVVALIAVAVWLALR
jgi:hypothetical protein